MKSINTVLFVSALSLVVGCAHNPPPRYAATTPTPVFRDDLVSAPQPPPRHTTVVPPAYPPNSVAANVRNVDTDLTTAVRNQFDRYGELSSVVPNLDINSQHGTVTLTGSVPGERERQMILAMVKNTPGVVAVNDLLRVADGQAPVQPTGRADQPSQVYPKSTDDYFNLHVQGLTETDRNLAQQILQGLRTDAALASSVPRVDINVADGQVTLRGIVQTEQQRQAIATTVQNAAGVGNVKNELQVQQVPR
jgi:osmotically-inducible protein OsmY